MSTKDPCPVFGGRVVLANGVVIPAIEEYADYVANHMPVPRRPPAPEKPIARAIAHEVVRELREHDYTLAGRSTSWDEEQQENESSDRTAPAKVAGASSIEEERARNLARETFITSRSRKQR
jgi:hypothetical protein